MIVVRQVSSRNDGEAISWPVALLILVQSVPTYAAIRSS